MDTEFKEKTYEKYFSNEVARLTNFTFSPDQCDENSLGFDDAFFLPDLPLILRPFVRRSRRARRSGIYISELDHLTERLVRRMPPFRFNLFVQYKRPERLKSRGAREWPHWGMAYYRFGITSHQQALLERIEAASHGRAATVYAAPAFWQSTDLFAYGSTNQIIANSNIASAGRLTGHGRYTYVAPGQNGIGHSEPQEISGPSLGEIVLTGFEANKPVDAKDHIIKTAAIVRDAAGQDEATAALLQLSEGAYPGDALRPSPLIKALATLEAFADAFGISTYMHGQDEPVSMPVVPA